jgi:hypothetical protein
LIQTEEKVIIAVLIHKYRGSFGSYFGMPTAGPGALATKESSN